MKRIFTILTLCGLFCSWAAAGTKRFTVHHYSVADGLPQNTVMAIMEDRDGFTWVGTWDGLCRFDGYQFHTYKPSFSGSRVASNRIDYLYEDSLGFIWTRTYDGAFYRINKHSDKILATDIRDTRFGNHLPYQNLLLEQQKGVIWLSGDNQLLRICEDETDNVSQQLYTLHGQASFLLKDASGMVWAGTTNGLEQFSEQQGCFYPSDNADENHFTAGLAIGDQLWLGTSSGLVWHYMPRGNHFEKARLELKEPITAIAQLDDKRLIITTHGDGFCIYDRTTGTSVHYCSKTHHDITSNAFDKPYVDQYGNAWFINEQLGVWRYTSADNKLQRYTIRIDERYRLQLDNNFFAFEDADGRVWINPQGGGFSCYDAENDCLISPLGGCTNMIHTACAGKHNSLWLGTYDLGLDRIDVTDERFQLSDLRRDEEHSGEVRSIYQLRNGNLVIGSKDRVVRIFNEQHELLSEDPVNCLVYAIAEQADGTLIYGTKGDGLIFRDGKKTRTMTHREDDVTSLSSNLIYDMVFGPDSTLYVATYGGGINIIRDGNCIHQGNNWDDYPDHIGEKVRNLEFINDSTLWAACTNGLLVVNTRTLQVKSYPFFDIRSIASTPDGHVWLGTFGGGLIEVLDAQADELLADSNMHVYTSLSDLLSDIILSVVPMPNGDLWFSYEEGLSHYDHKSHSFQHFSVLSTVPHASFSEARARTLRSGEICFGYNFGCCSFRPDEIFSSKDFPNIYFTDFLLANKPVEIGPNSPLSEHICYAENIHLVQHQQVFTINYAAIDYAAPEHILYAYKMDGVDDDWNYVEHSRSATYTNLSPGDYVFRVHSTNADGVWGDNERSIAIHISPSIWATPTAWAIYFFLLCFFVWLIWHNFRTGNQLRQEMAIEQKVTEIKLRFFTNISHELRTPLTLITGPVENVLHNEDLAPAVRTQLEIVSSNASRMLRLINQILDFRKIQNQKMRLRVQNCNLVKIAESTFANFTKEAVDKHVSFNFEPASPEVMAWVDRDKLDTIIYNLLSNAFKFTPSGKSITLRVSDSPNYAIVEVTDTGIGIPKDKRAFLFERFASNNEINVNPDKPGTGIGLNLVKELVDLHHGYIEVTSEPGQGSSFKVMLLHDRDHFHQTEADIIFDDQDLKQQPEVNAEQDADNVINVDPGKNTILVVDDNDDMRVFLQSILSADYNVLSAADGEEALSVAEKGNVNLVITDLMMPKMDGLELTERLKSNIQTSHLPVVLLTAKTAIESRLEALQFGADDYITKPFSPEYLLARVDNIIRQRERLQETYRRNLLTPKEAEPEQKQQTPDDIFMEKLYTFMMQNIDNNALTVDDLVHEMAFGRTVFFNKLKSLTGLSPVEYIRDVRIKYAAELILDSKHNITEVAYMVGMNDSRYFAKCFKAAYGITPTEYKRQHSKKDKE